LKLERHVGGLSIAKKVAYLAHRGWRREAGGHWQSPVPVTDPVPLAKAIHHQLTEDLTRALSAFGWKVVDFTDRGYARLEDPVRGDRCSLPAALRRQARRERRPVRELTVALFVSAANGPID